MIGSAAKRVVMVVAVLAVAGGLVAHRTSDQAQALTNCSTGTMAIDAVEQEMLELMNQARTAEGLAPLKLSPNLSRAAAWKAEDQTQPGQFSHQDSLGRQPQKRAADCGYRGSGAGENLAIGSLYASASGAFEGFMTSTLGHRFNIVCSDGPIQPAPSVCAAASYRVVGIGRSGSSWALKFGNYDDSSDPWDSAAAPSQPAQPTAPVVPTAQPTAVAPTATPQVAGIMQSLSAGMHLVSYEGFPQAPELALHSLGGAVNWVYGWDAAGQQWLRYSPGAPAYVNTLQFMVPGMAYYISVDHAVLWAY